MTKQEREKFLSLIDQYVANLSEQMHTGLAEEFTKMQGRLELYLAGTDDSRALSDGRWSFRIALDETQKKIDVIREFRKLIEKMPVVEK